MGNCAGVDWASEEHATCVVSDEGHVMFERAFLHSEGGMAELCASLVANDVDRVALERPDGIVCERLLEAGISVVAIHPNQLKATRDRYTVSRRKSDRFDAFCLAELCRTDMHRFRVLRPDSDETKALRALTRSRQQLVNARQILANQLRAELEAFWPGAGCVFRRSPARVGVSLQEQGQTLLAEPTRILRAPATSRSPEQAPPSLREVVALTAVASRYLLSVVNGVTREREIGHNLVTMPSCDWACQPTQGHLVEAVTPAGVRDERVLRGEGKVLEVGTGFGFQTALVAYLASFVWGIECWPDIAETRRREPGREQIQNVEVAAAGRHR